MFIGRQEELKKLKKEISSDKKSAVLIYGKRRIGKSTLIAEALKGFKGTVIDHFCVQSSLEGNLELLSRSVSRALNMPQLSFKRLSDLFEFLGQRKEKTVVVLDEYPYLKESRKKKEVDSYMQGVIDRLPSNVSLILCGSYISVMRELLEETNPLFGRFTLVMNIKELDYYDASLFYPEADTRTKIERYAVFGGSPYVLGSLDTGGSIADNVIDKLLPETGIYRTFIESIALQEIRKSFDVRILEIIGNGRKKYSEILSSLNSRDNGYLDKQLKALLSMDTLQKEFPINKPKDKKKQFYSINDNLMRYYFTFVFGKEGVIRNIGEENFYRQEIEQAQNTFVSLRFEEIVMQYFRRLARSGKRRNIKDIGSFWYDDPETCTSGQFDCVLKTNKGYEFYECKFYEKAMKQSECDQESEQVKSIFGIESGRPGFVCSAGFAFADKKYDLIAGDELFDL